MKTRFLKIIKDVLKGILPNKFDIGTGVLLLIIGLPMLYLLDTYIFPCFTSKINAPLVGKILVIFLIGLFSLAIIFSYLSDKYKIPTGTDEITMKDEDSRKIFKGALSIFRWLLLPIVIGLVIQVSWKSFNSIKEENIMLFDVARDSSNSIPNISVSPIEIKLSWLKRNKLKLYVYNSSRKTLRNGILHINLPKGCRVIGGETWIPTSNTSVYANLININPNIKLFLWPLELEFIEPKTYEAEYSISGEDFRTPQRKMLIKVLQE